MWWPNIESEIEMNVKSCKSCQIKQATPAKAPIHPWEKTTVSCMRIHIDFAWKKCFLSFMIPIQNRLMQFKCLT